VGFGKASSVVAVALSISSVFFVVTLQSSYYMVVAAAAVSEIIIINIAGAQLSKTCAGRF
jgi:hypothetical protein